MRVRIYEHSIAEHPVCLSVVSGQNVRTTATNGVYTPTTIMPRLGREARSRVPAGQIFVIFFLVIGDRGELAARARATR